MKRLNFAKKNRTSVPITEEESARAVEAFMAKGGAVTRLDAGETALEDHYSLTKAMAAWGADHRPKD